MKILKTYRDGSRKIELDDGLQVSLTPKNVVEWCSAWMALDGRDDFDMTFRSGHGDPYAQIVFYTYCR